MGGIKYAGALGLLTLLRLANVVSGQTNSTCISLQGSRMCQNFTSASVSTSLTDDFPFLEFVSTVEEFDTQFTTFIQQQYTKYLQLLTMSNWQEKVSGDFGVSGNRFSEYDIFVCTIYANGIM